MIILIAFDKTGRRIGYIRKRSITRERSPKRFTALLTDAMAFNDVAGALTWAQAQHFEAPMMLRTAERLSPAEARQYREAA